MGHVSQLASLMYVDFSTKKTHPQKLDGDREGQLMVLPHQRYRAIQLIHHRILRPSRSLPRPCTEVGPHLNETGCFTANSYSLQQVAGLLKLSTDNIDDPIRAIAARTKTFIECPGPKDQKLSIWATHKSFVEAAQRQLAAWINPPRQLLASRPNQKAQPQSNFKGPKNKMMPSVHPQTQKDIIRIEKALKDKRKKETYRQDPGPREIFVYTVSYHDTPGLSLTSADSEGYFSMAS